MKYTRDFLEDELPKKLRAKNKAAGRDPYYLPTREEIAEMGHDPRSLNLAIQREIDEETTLSQYLKRLGFRRPGDDDKWPGDHRPTHKFLDDFEYTKKNRQGCRDATITSIQSRLRKLLRLYHESTDEWSVFDLGKAKSEPEKTRKMKMMCEILDIINEEFDSEDSKKNYADTWKYLFEFVDRHHEQGLDFNPVSEAIKDFNWSYSRDDTPALSPDQWVRMWEATGEFKKEKEYKMKVFLAFYLAIGPRNIDFFRLDPENDVVLDEDNPHVIYTLRKNLDREDLPETVPIMCCQELIEKHTKRCRRRDADQILDVTDDTLRNWTEKLADIADIELPGDATVSPKRIRQLWHTRYASAIVGTDDAVEHVAAEQGTKSTKEAEGYIDPREECQTLREEGRKAFEEIVPDDYLADVPYIRSGSRTTHLEEFNERHLEEADEHHQETETDDESPVDAASTPPESENARLDEFVDQHEETGTRADDDLGSASEGDAQNTVVEDDNDGTMAVVGVVAILDAVGQRIRSRHTGDEAPKLIDQRPLSGSVRRARAFTVLTAIGVVICGGTAATTLGYPIVDGSDLSFPGLLYIADFALLWALLQEQVPELQLLQ